MARIFGLMLFLLGAVLVTSDAAAACSPTLTDFVRDTDCDTRAAAISAVDSMPSAGFCAALYGPGHDNVKTDNTYPGSKLERRYVQCQISGQSPKGGFQWSARWIDESSPECEAGIEYWSSSVPGNDPDEILCNSNNCEVKWTGWGIGEDYLWRSTGQECPVSESGDDEEDDGTCHDLGSGFRWCPDDPPFCVRSPSGGLLCPDVDKPDCRSNSSGMLCHDKSPPRDGWDPKPDFEYCHNFQCVIFTPATPKDDDNGDDDDGDDEDPPDPDCPANDPDCEDDDDDDAPRASDSGCGTETPSCSDMGHVDCQILIRTHRTNCTVAYGNEMLEEFRDRNIEELRENNAKLKAIKDTMIAQHLSAFDLQQAQALTATQSLEKLRDIQSAELSTGSAVRQSKDQLISALQGQTDALVSAIEGQGGEGGGPGGGDPGGGGDLVITLDPAPDQDADRSMLESFAMLTTVDIGPGSLDQSGYLGGGACPVFPPLTIGGLAWSMDDVYWCDFLTLLHGVFMLFGAIAAGRILMGG